MSEPIWPMPSGFAVRGVPSFSGAIRRAPKRPGRKPKMVEDFAEELDISNQYHSQGCPNWELISPSTL